MPKQERKYSAPDWKVGDIVYYKWDGSYRWQEKEIIGETSRSWLVVSKGAQDYQRNPENWAWEGTKLPKSGTATDKYGNVDHWQAGTKLTMEQAIWLLENYKTVASEIQFSSRKLTPMGLLGIAKILELDSVVTTFPEEKANA
jgi:hypothetical protein